MAVTSVTKPHDILLEFKPTKEILDKKPDCCSERQYLLWAASFCRSKENRFGFSLMCRDCTPAFKKRVGDRCSFPEIVFVWRRVAGTKIRDGVLYELIGVPPEEVHSTDRSVKEDDPAILFGYKKFSY